MDFHILIVIGCVFGASLLSFLFINKIFRRKTFEEVVAEKRALNANLYAQHKNGSNAAGQRKPKKKELKREKKQRQREQQKDNASNNDQEEQEDYSDGHSEEQGSVGLEEESTQPGLSKQHVEFDPDPEVLNEQRRPSSAEKENHPNNITNKKGKKDKRNGSAPKPAVGILVNKNEAVPVKPIALEETPSLNNFEVRVPKDVVELKKQEQKERKEDNNNSTKQQAQKKNGNAVKKDKPTVTVALLSAAMEQPVEVPHVPLPKQTILKQQQHPMGSPKSQHNNVNKNKQQQHGSKKQKETSLNAKDLVHALDKLVEHQTFGVSALMNVFSRAELNRSEIQILIDYLLNKQQDMPANHGDWSDDICQKLKRQLEEKDKQLAEAQEASMGIQAKLRELRQEINTERAQIHSRSQAFTEKLLSKDQELAALNQELASANEKLALERQHFQAKLLHEKQASSQDLLSQLQRLQQDLAHKEKVIADMTTFVNAESQQKNEVIQQQAQQLIAIEQQRDELEARLNNTVFEMEQRRQLESENAELKEELRNLTNALESLKVELQQSQGELARVCNTELQELRKQTATLEASNVCLNQQLSQANSQAVQASVQQSEQAQAQAEALSNLQAEYRTLHGIHAAQQQQNIVLRSQLDEAQQRAEKLQDKQRQLEHELQEQRDKNNDIRMKNWKLIEALQNAEATARCSATAKTKTNTAQSLGQQHKQLQQQQQQQQQLLQEQRDRKTIATNGGDLSCASSSSAKGEQQRIRELYQRLYPEAVKVHAATALSASFEEWLEQVLTTHIKQQQPPVLSSSNKSTQSNSSGSECNSNNSTSSNSDSDHTSTHNNISSNNSNSNSQFSASAAEQQELHTQNLKLRKRNDELTQLVTKTSNTLVDLEQRAREQEDHWRSIVSQKEQLISKLQQHAANGEQDI